MIYNEFLVLEPSNNGQLFACCPFHPDNTPSFTVNEETEAWYCFACSVGGGPVQFLQKYFDIDEKVASYLEREYVKRKKIALPSIEYLEKCHKLLLAKPRELEVLKSFGISEEIIKRYKVGWDDIRYTIPIPSKTAHIVNVRKYLPPHKRLAGDKMGKTISMNGLGQERFFPYIAFEEEIIWIVEGEKDCLSARSQGLNAVTSTGGSNIPYGECGLFKGKIVNIMVDNDIAGDKLRKAYSRVLEGVAKEINNYQLPKKDFVDFYMAYNTSDVSAYKSKVVNDRGDKLELKSSPKQDLILERVSLSESEAIAQRGKWVQLQNMSIIGTDPEIYEIPTELLVDCRDVRCSKPCGVAACGGSTCVTVDERAVIEFLDNTDMAQSNYLRKLYGCKSIQSEPSKTVNAQRFIFQEAASFIDGLDEATFESRTGIYLYEGSNRLLPTLRYDFEVKAISDPRSQKIFYLVRRAEPVTKARQVDTSNLDFLDYFREISDSSKSIFELLDRHYRDWLPVLGIEGRLDLFGTVLMTYLSVTEIPWGGAHFKGWLDTMVIGDTRTGKSQLAQRFVKHLELGGYINGENAKATGVIGGVSKLGNSWMITWGATPMNDRGMLTIDEASGLSIETIKEFSSTRSSGAVTINKIVKGEAKARTRLLWLSNPREGKNLSEYFYKGFDAFKRFIPVAEDQARYDIVISAAREDVTELNYRTEIQAPNYTVYRQLVSMAWSLERSDILISRSVVEFIAVKSRELDNEFGGGPLVVGAAVYEKLCRIGASIAVLCGSFDTDLKLVIESKHIQYAVDFLVSTYNKSSFGYGKYIRKLRMTQEEREQHTLFVRGMVEHYPGVEILLSSNSFRSSQVQEILGLERSDTNKFISELIIKKLIKPARNGSYAPSPLLIEIVSKMEEED